MPGSCITDIGTGVGRGSSALLLRLALCLSLDLSGDEEEDELRLRFRCCFLFFCFEALRCLSSLLLLLLLLLFLPCLSLLLFFFPCALRPSLPSTASSPCVLAAICPCGTETLTAIGGGSDWLLAATLTAGGGGSTLPSVCGVSMIPAGSARLLLAMLGKGSLLTA